jgi:HAD superfamily hydrolase (TIGR01549 family)
VTFRFVYFDIDDTLLNHRHAERAALQDVRNLMPVLQRVPVEDLWATYGTINRGLWEQYGKGDITRQELQHLRFALTMGELGIPDSFQDAISALYMKQYRKSWTWMPGAKDALKKVHAQTPVGFLTNGFAEVQLAKQKAFDLGAYSDIYVISEEVGCMKPSKCIFDHATKRTGLEPGDILYVGDSHSSDIQGAKRFGWQTAWLTDQENDPTGMADVIVGSMSELVAKLY